MAGYERTTKILGVKKVGDGYNLVFDTEWGPADLVLNGNALLNITFKVWGKQTKGGIPKEALADSKLKGKRITIVISD